LTADNSSSNASLNDVALGGLFVQPEANYEPPEDNVIPDRKDYKAPPVDVMFLVDRSNSMYGSKMKYTN